jgi:hypothetical protein
MLQVNQRATPTAFRDPKRASVTAFGLLSKQARGLAVGFSLPVCRNETAELDAHVVPFWQRP